MLMDPGGGALPFKGAVSLNRFDFDSNFVRFYIVNYFIHCENK